MRESTPALPETMEHGQLTVETLDEVTPRLQAFTQRLIDLLRAAGVEVETTSSFLLNSTQHRIDVPSFVDGMPVEFTFDAALPVWSLHPVARLQLSFNHGRRYYWNENKTFKFPINAILRRCLTAIHLESERWRKQQEASQKQTLATHNFSQLSQELEIEPKVGTPDTLIRGNVKLTKLDATPTQVRLTIVVPHKQAVEIVKQYGKKQF